jgi:hypothetical protein
VITVTTYAGPRVTKRQVLEEAATLSTYAATEIVAAVQAAPAAKITEYARAARADGLRSAAAVASEVAWRIADEAGVTW